MRGAPAIAVVGGLSLAVELHQKDFEDVNALVEHVIGRLDYLVTARPTAVNMADTACKVSALAKQLLQDQKLSVKDVKNK